MNDKLLNCDPSKQWEPLAQIHNVTSQKTWILIISSFWYLFYLFLLLLYIFCQSVMCVACICFFPKTSPNFYLVVMSLWLMPVYYIVMVFYYSFRYTYILNFYVHLLFIIFRFLLTVISNENSSCFPLQDSEVVDNASERKKGAIKSGR
jgi:hypothetical protein